MLVFIQQQLHAMQADGTLAQMQAATEKRIAAHVLRPTPVPGLHRAVKAAVDDIDPSVTVDHDIADTGQTGWTAAGGARDGDRPAVRSPDGPG